MSARTRAPKSPRDSHKRTRTPLNLRPCRTHLPTIPIACRSQRTSYTHPQNVLRTSLRPMRTRIAILTMRATRIRHGSVRASSPRGQLSRPFVLSSHTSPPHHTRTHSLDATRRDARTPARTHARNVAFAASASFETRASPVSSPAHMICSGRGRRSGRIVNVVALLFAHSSA